MKEIMKQVKWGAMLITWLGGLALLATTIREMAQDTNSIVNEIVLWIFFSATVVVGFSHYWQFLKRN